jgi:hypothetical protein
MDRRSAISDNGDDEEFLTIDQYADLADPLADLARQAMAKKSVTTFYTDGMFHISTNLCFECVKLNFPTLSSIPQKLRKSIAV